MKIKFSMTQLLIGLTLSLFSSFSMAAKPLWTMEALTPTSAELLGFLDAVCVKYRVTNQSLTTHTLRIIPISGGNQIVSFPIGSTICNPVPVTLCGESFTLAYQQSCDLVLTFGFNPQVGNIVGGPLVCEQANPLQCYQPNPGETLSISYKTSP